MLIIVYRRALPDLALGFLFQLFFLFLLFGQFFLTFFVAVIWCCQCSLSML